ncbi:MAG: UvrD-helicase domain-containing protein, partial [Pseudomonadota bacterium]
MTRSGITEDTVARQAAVRIDHSVIVQAPAGSGKTTLLVERYLNLLASVDEPEDILAITFTRKAAGEMRERVLKVLAPDFHSDATHEQGLVRANAALRTKLEDWQLLAQPQRLMIRTIDSFNHFLTRTMPVGTQLGPVPAASDDSTALYRQTARRVLALGEQDNRLGSNVSTVLEWLDNHRQRLEDLLVSMLGQREQWLNALAMTGNAEREQLEATLEALVSAQLQEAAARFKAGIRTAGIDANELCEGLQAAARGLQEASNSTPAAAFASAELPAPSLVALPQWQALAEFFLTKRDGLRRKLDKNIGFPPQSDLKDWFAAILARVPEDSPIPGALASARALPRPRYEDDQWQALQSLVAVLRRCAAELELLFAEIGESDYAGLAAAALRGLGDEDDGYTDLGLYLDRRIAHILVDEFQDTNGTQFRLLEKLTAGWEPGDGRTLFLVGDPMQSIYRFREAEVGLFLKAREQGIGAVTLTPLTLTCNFRSRPAVVHWVNEQLARVFPARENISSGATAYTPSLAGRDDHAGAQVLLRAAADADAEAEMIARHLKDALAGKTDQPQFRAAIIVRARSHLERVLPALDRHSLRYRAVALDPLLDRPVAQDLLALTRVLYAPGDRTALLALLRAPWCGLTLDSLLTLAEQPRALLDDAALALLPAAERARAGRLQALLADAPAHYRSRDLRALVEGAWTRLGGPATCANPESDLRDAQLFFEALEAAEAAGACGDWNDLQERLQRIRTEGDPPSDDVRIEVLTVHGAKGLEWDLVVLPGLHKRPTGSDSRLLHWLPVTRRDGATRMLLAPLRSAADDELDTPLVKLIRDEQQLRDRFESQRLLYVATTRAREELLLSAVLDAGDADFKPATGSLLSELWQGIEAPLRASAETPDPPGAAVAAEP